MDVGDLEMQAGDEFFILNDDGRKTGIVKISQVKNGRAAGKILKGSVVVGEKLSEKPKEKSAAAADSSSNDDSDSSIEKIRERNQSKNYLGILFGYSMDSLSLQAADNSNPALHSEGASLTGNSFKIKAFYDRPYSEKYTFRFIGGYDGFNGSYSAKNNTINKDGSMTSNLAVTFLTAEFEFLWNFYKKTFATVWLSGGYSFQYVINLSSNMYSLQLGSSYLNSVFVGTGANIKMSKTSFLPIYFHYNYFVAGSGVTQSAINIGAGWGWNYK